MEAKINEVLQPGETVEWSGRPQQVKLMEAPYGLFMIVRVICAVLLVAAAGFLLFGPMAPESMDPAQARWAMLVCVIIALYLVLDPIYVLNKLNKQTCYYITDRRAITCYLKKGGKIGKLKMRTLDELDEVTIDKLSNGNGLLYLGKKNKRAPKVARTQFAFTDLQDREEEMPLMFYSIGDIQGALGALPAGLCR